MTESDTSATATADAGTSPEGTQQATGVENTATTGTDQGTPDVTAATNPSLPTNTSAIPSPAKTAEPPTIDWSKEGPVYQKRFNDTLSSATKLHQQYQEMQKQLQPWQGLDPNEVRAAMAERQRQAQISNLKAWNAGHPEFNRFEKLRDKASNYQRLLSRAETPEQKETLKSLLSSEFSPDELRQLEEADTDNRQLLSRFQSDPRGFLAEMVQPVIAQAFQQYESFNEARVGAQQWLTDPNNSTLIGKYAPQMDRMMDPQVPGREKAFTVAQLMAENEALKARLSKDAETVAQAAAQQDALKGRATGATRGNTRTSQSIGDPVEYLKKQGIEAGHPEFIARLQKLNSRHT